MSHRRHAWVVALVLVLALVAAACGGGEDDGEQPRQDQEVTKGGTLNWESEEYAHTNAFDPTGEYLGSAWTVYSNMMLRTLVGYRHLPGDEGNEIVPDLATDLPDISEDGLTYTFTIKDGVKFGPPVSREIVCDDVKYAFQRIADDKLVAQYGFYYDTIIEGMEKVKSVDEDITGITCNGDKEIEFTLTEATGDFPYRLAMPATAPIPEEVAKCFTKAGDYGRYVISSAGYMFEGADKLDITSCKTMKPISGWDPTKQMTLVRNPDYDQATDDTRENNIDSFVHTINTNTNNLEQKVVQDESDIIHNPTPPTLRKFSTQSDLQDRLHVDPGDRTWYITMNLSAPPFDDIHIRKAANLVMDKEGLRRAWGGPTQGEIATHIVPDTMLGGALDDYDPYPSEGHAGDVEAAKEEVKQSKYDKDGDGVCDDPSCKGVLQIGSNTPPNTDMLPVVESSLEKIGITLDSKEVTDAYTPIQTVAKQVPISIRPGWGKDYADPYTFIGFLFHGDNILCTGNTNYSLVGLTPDKAKECGIEYPDEPVPSVDEDIDKCIPLQGEERIDCWADLDKKIMEEVVPWVPYLDANSVWATSSHVTQYVFDQFSSEPAWSRIALAKGQ